MSESLKKKRGRKPKNFNNLLQKNDNNISEDENSENEKIIFHLPITTDDINFEEQESSIFIKPDKNVIKSPEETELSAASQTCSSNKILNNHVNKIITHNLNFNKNTKCWWCKNQFNTPAVQLPEDFYNDTFYCIGNFCSFNCMKSYNLDLNDFLTSKRESLMNLLYFMTYSEHKTINSAPHWITLEEFGGNLSIEVFRKNSLMNTKEYTILHPPLISRQMQFEESYKINTLKEVSIDKINKIYSDIDSEYIIKRKSPLQSKQSNLETMGIIKRKTK